jgi:hypothetical protein
MKKHLSVISFCLAIFFSASHSFAQFDSAPSAEMIKSMLLQQGLSEDQANQFIQRAQEIQAQDQSRQEKGERMKDLFQEYGVQPPPFVGGASQTETNAVAQ